MAWIDWLIDSFTRRSVDWSITRTHSMCSCFLILESNYILMLLWRNLIFLKLIFFSISPVQIVEMMSLTPEVSDFLDKIGNFYELISDDGRALPQKKKAADSARNPVPASTINGSATSSTAKQPSTTLTLTDTVSSSTKRPLPPIVDATFREMLRPVVEESSEEDDLEEAEVFQDARSNSESEGLRYHPPQACLSRTNVNGSSGNEEKAKEKSAFQTLFPELQKLKLRMEKMEQRGDNHAERLLAVELLAGRLAKQRLPSRTCNGLDGSSTLPHTPSSGPPFFSQVFEQWNFVLWIHQYWVAERNEWSINCLIHWSIDSLIVWLIDSKNRVLW